MSAPIAVSLAVRPVEPSQPMPHSPTARIQKESELEQGCRIWCMLSLILSVQPQSSGTKEVDMDSATVWGIVALGAMLLGLVLASPLYWSRRRTQRIEDQASRASV